MANKTLTAKLKLETTQAERALKNLDSKINKINKAINKTEAKSFTRQIERSSKAADTLNSKVQRVTRSLRTGQSQASKLASAFTRASSKLTSAHAKTNQWANAQKRVSNNARSTNSQYKQSNSLLGSIGSKLKHLAATYLGLMGTKAMLDTSDVITSAQNKLNYVNAQQLGSAGANADGSYSNATFKATQDSMDKMYASAQKVRMAYDDMMSNVSKSMALAGGSFQNNTDNAIRFQEIMAEAYAVGGASAAEMSSSMYQLIQALGAGTLAGDELRSVREGAPLAYKAIEEFVQGVYNTEESLKDLASQGKVTSDMVVAAIMKEGDALDKAFGNTTQTFAQTWDQIKNAAIYAFKPISTMLSNWLNEAIDNGLIQKIESFFSIISKVVQITLTVMKIAIDWIVENWSWLQWVVLGVVLVIIGLLVQMAAVAVWTAIVTAYAWIKANWGLLLIVAAVVAILYAFDQLKQGAISMTEFLVYCALIIAAAFLIAGIIMMSIPMLVIAIIIAVLAVVFYFFEQICGYAMITYTFVANAGATCASFLVSCINWLGAVWANICSFFVNLWNGCTNWVSALWNNCIAGIVNVAMGLYNSISAIAQNIGIAFENAWNGALSTFWNFIASCLEGLSALEGPINAILTAFGKDTISIRGAASKLRSKAGGYKQKSYVSVSDAWASGMNTRSYQNLGDAWSSGFNTNSYKSLSDAWTFDEDFGKIWSKGWSDEAYAKGYNWGSGVKGSINEWGSQFQDGTSIFDSLANGLGNGGALDKVGNALGLDFGNATGTGGYPNAGNSKYDPSKSYKKPSYNDLLNGVDGIADDVGNISDSIDLTQDDLEYLRRLADMEWKKEYTTANIKIDMSNYNTVNGDSDLDGIVTKLADKLYEEMNIVADGVYA